MSGKRPKKSQRLGSSRRGPRGLNRNNEEKDNDDGFPQIAESEDEQKESHSTTDNQSGDTPLQVQFDHLPNSSSDQPISSLECPPHAMSQSHKDAVVETELPERKRKMGSTRKKTGGFKVERKLKCEADDEMRTTEELCEEQLAQPITSAIEEDQSNLHEQSRSWILPSNLSQQTEGYGLGLELWATHDIEVIASKNKENVAIPHLEISSHSLTKDISSYEVESNMPMYMGHSVHLSAVTLTESGLLLQKQTPLDSTSSQKRKTGSTRRPHRGNTGEGDSENIEVQEHPSTERVEKVEVQAKFNLSGEMMQTWDDVVKGDSPTDKSSHTESAFISNQSFLSEKAKKSDVSAGTETNKQSVAFPVVDPAKPLPETPSYDGTPLLNENFDSKIGSEALSPPKSDNNALNTVIKEVESNLTDCNHDEPDIRSDKKTSQESRAVNTGQTKKEVLKQKKEPSRNYSMITLSSKQDTVSKELVLNDKESSSVPRQHHSATTDNNCDLSTDVLTIGGSRSSDKLESYIIHAEPTATDSPLEMSDTGPYIPTSEFAKKETFIRSSTSEQKRKKVSTLRKRMKYSKENLHVQASENFIEGIEINSETWQEKTWPKEMEENSASERDVSESSLYSANNKMVNLSSGTVHLHDSNLNFNNQFPEGSQFSCDAKAKAMVCSQSPESKINNEALHAHIGSTVEEGQERYFQMKPEKNTCDDNVSFREVKLIGDTIKVKRNVTNQSDFLQNDTPIDRNQEALKLSENVENVSTVTDSDLLLRYLDTVCSREAEIVPEKTELNINPEDSHRLELHSVLNPVAHKRKMGSIRRPLGGNKGQRKGKEHHNDNETLNSESISNREVEIIDMEDDHGPDKSTLRTSETKDGTTVKDREKFVENKAGPVEGIDSDHMSSSCSSDIQASTAVGISDILEEQTLTGFCAETLENSGDVEEVPVGEDIEPHLDIQTQNITFDSTTNEGERTEENIHDVSVLVKPTEVIGDIIAVKSNVTIDSDFHQNDTPIDRNQEALNVENVSTVTDSGLSLRDVDTVGSREADTVPEKTEININPEDSHRLELHSILNPVAHKRKMGSTRRPLGGNKDQRKGKENHNDNEKLNSESIRNKEVEIFDMEDGHGPDKSTLRTSETKDGTTVKDREKFVENKAGPVEGIDSDHMWSSCSSDIQESTAVGISDILEEQTLTGFCAETLENSGDVEEVPVGEDIEPHLDIQTQNITFDSTTNEGERTEENIHDVSVLVKPTEVIGDINAVKSNVTIDSDFHQNDTPIDRNQEALNVENVSTVTDSGLSLRDVDTVGSREADTVPEKSEININPEDSHRLELHSVLNPVAQKRKMGSIRRPLGGNKGQRKGKEHHNDNETLNSESISNREVEIIDMEDDHGPDKSTLRTSETKDGTTVKDREKCVENKAGPVEGIDSDHMSSSCSSDIQASTAVGISDILEEQTLTGFCAETLENSGDVEEVPVGEDIEPHLDIQTQNITFDSTTNEGERTEENIHDVSVLVKPTEVIGDIIAVKSNVTIDSDFHQNDTPIDRNQEALNVENVSTVTDSGLSLRDVDTVGSREADTVPEKTEININPEDSHRLELHSILNPVAHKRKMGSTRRPLGGNKDQRKGKEHLDDNETLNSESIRNKEVEIFDVEDEPRPDKSTLRTSETKDGTTENEREICVENNTGPFEGVDSAHMPSSFSSDFQESTAVGISDILEEQTLTEFCAETLENAGDVEEVPVGEDTEPHLEIHSQNITGESSTNEGERTEENIHDVSVLVKAIEVIGDTITVKSNVTTQSDFLQNDTPTDINQEALKVSNVSTVTDSGLFLRDFDTVDSREADTVPEKTELNINPEDSHRLELHSVLNPVAQKRKMGSIRRPLGGNKGQRKGKEHHNDNEKLNSESIRNREVEIFDMEDGHGPDKSTLRTSETKDGTTVKDREKFVENKAGPVEGIDSDHMSSSCSSDIQASTAVGISDILEEQTITGFCAETLENSGDVEEVPVGEDIEPHLDIQTQNITFDSTTNEGERTEENIHDVSVLVKPTEVIGDIIAVKSNVTIDSDFHQNDTPIDRNQEALNVENVSTVTDSGLSLRDVDTVGSREADTVPEKTEININPEDSHRLELHSILNPVAHKRKMGSTRRPLGGNKDQRKGKEHLDDNETLNSESIRNKEVEIFDVEDEPRPDKSTLRTSETKDGTTENEREICVENNTGPFEGVDSAHMPSSFSSDFQESTAVGISDILEEQTLTEFCAETLENAGDVEEVPVGEDTEPHLEIHSQNITGESSTNEGERTEENIHDVSVLVKAIEVIGDTITVKSNVTTQSDFLQNDTPTDINQEALKVSNVSTVTDSGLFLRDFDTVDSREADTVPEKTELNINPEDSHRLELHSVLNPVAHKRKMGSIRRPLGGNKGQRKGKENHNDNEKLNSESIRNREVEIFDMEDGHGPDKSTLRTSETKDGTTVKDREKFVENKAGPVEGIDSDHMSSSCSSDIQASTAVGISDILEEQTLTGFCAETLENSGDVEEVPVGEDIEPHLDIQTQNITFDSTTNEGERTKENIHDVSVLVKPTEVIGDIIAVKSNVTIDSDFHQNDTPIDRNQEALNVENVSTVTDSGLSLRDVDTVGSREADTVPEKTEININPEDSHRLELHSILNPVAHKRKMGSTRRPLGGNKDQRKGKEHLDDNETLNSESIRNKEVEIFDVEDEPRPDKSTLRTSETKDGTTENEREICVENNTGPFEGVDSAHMPSSFSSDFQESTAVGISDILEEQTLTEFCAETLENAGDVEEVPVGEDIEPHLDIRTQNINFDSTTNEGERTEENIHDVSVLVKPIEVIGDIITVKSNVTTDSDFLQNDTPIDRNQEALKVTENENVENVSTVTDSGLLLRDVDTVGSREADIVPEKTEISINPEDSHRQELHSKLNPVAHKQKMGSTRRPLGGNKGQRKGKEHHEGNVTLYSKRNKEVETFDVEDEPRPDKSTLRTSETKDGTTEKEKEICLDNNAGSVEGVDSAHMPSSFSSDFQESTAVGISDILEEQTLTEFCAETLENAGDFEEVPVGEDTEQHLEIKTQNITVDSSTNEVGRTEEFIHDVSVLVKAIEDIGDTITVKSNVTTQSDCLQNDTPTDINQEAMKVSENVENVSTVTDSGLSLRDVDTVGSREADTVPEKTEININPEDSHRLELHSILNPVAHKRKMGSTRRPLGGNKDQRKGKEHLDDNETLNSESIRNKEVEIFDVEDEHGPDKSTLRTSETKDGTIENEREICVENNTGPFEGVDSAHMPSSFSSDFQESTAVGISDILEEQTLTEFCAETLENAGDVEEVPVGEDTDPHLEIQSQNITGESSTNEGERTEENIHDVSVLVKASEVIGDNIAVKSNVTTQSDFLQNDTPFDRNQEALKVSENENVENVSTVTDSGLLLRDVDTVGSREADIVPEKSEININPEDSHRLELHSVLNPVAQKRKMGSTRRPLGGNKGQRKGKEHHDDNETLNSESIRNREVEIFDMEYGHGPDKSTLRTSETNDGTTKKEREKCVENKAGPVEGIDSAHMSSSCSSDFQASTAVGISDILDEQTLTEFCAETLENAGDVEEVPVVEGTEPQIETQTQNITFDSTTNEEERTEENIHDVSVLVKPIEVIGDIITVKSNVTTDSDFLQNDTPFDRNQEALKVSENENVENVFTVTDSGLLLRDVDTVGSREADIVPEKSEININPEDSHRLELHSVLNPVAQKRKMGSTRRPLGGNKGQGKGKELHEGNVTLFSERNKEVETFDMEDEPRPDKSTLRTSETKDGTTEKEREICVDNNAGSVEGVDSAHMPSSFSSDFQESTAEGISDILEEQTLTGFCAETLENSVDVEEVPAGEETEPHLEIQTQNITFDSTTNEGERTGENIHDVSVLVKPIEVIGDIITVKSNVTTDSDFLQNDTPIDRNQEALKVSENENVENVSTVTDSGLLLRDVDTVGSREADIVPEKTEISINPEDSHRQELHSKLNPVAHKRKVGSTRRPLGGKKGQGKGKELHEGNVTLYSERNKEVETFDMEDEPRPDKSTLRTSETKDGTTEKEREICVDNNAGSVEGVDSAHMPSSFSSDFQESTAEGISDMLDEQTFTEFCAETMENAGDVEEVPVGEDTEPHLEIQSQNITGESSTNERERTEENIHDVSVLVKPIEVIGDTITVKSNVTTQSDFLQNDTPTDINQEALKVSENVENVSTVTDSGLSLRDVDTVGSREADTVPEKTEININPEDSHRLELHSILNPVAHKRKMGSTRRPLGGNKGQRKGKEHHDDNETLNSESIRNREVEIFDMEYGHGPDKSTLRTSETNDGTTKKEREKCVENKAGPVEGIDSAHMSSSCSSDFQASTAVGISDILDEQTLTEFCAETLENAGDVEEVPVVEGTEPQIETQTQNITFDSTTNEEERTEENIHDVSVLVKPIEVIGDIITVKSNVTTDSDFLQNDTPFDRNQEALKVSENENVENVFTVTDSGLLLRDVDTVGSREADIVPEKYEININPEDSHRLELHSVLNPVAQKRKMGSTRRPLGGNKGQGKGKELHEGNVTLFSERNKEVETFDMEDEPRPDKSTLRTSETKDGTTEKEREICVDNNAGSVEGVDSAHMPSSFSSDFQESTAEGISDILEEQTLTGFCAETLENSVDVEEVPAGEETEPHLEIQTQNITFDSTTNEGERTGENIHDVSVLVKPIEVIGDIITVKSNVTTDSDFLQNDTPIDRNQEALKVSENENVENVSTVTDSGLLLRDVDTVGSREADIVPEKTEISINPEDSHRQELHSKLNPVAHKRKVGSTRRPLGGKKGQGKGKELHEGNVTLYSERNKEVETFDMEDEPRPDKSTLRTSETKDGTTEKEREICVDNNAGSVEGVDSAHMPSSFSSDFQESTAEGISDMLDEQTFTEFCAETMENAGDVEEVPVGEDTEPHLEIQSQNITGESSTNERERTEENIHDVSVLVKPIEVIGDTITVKSNVTTQSDFLQNDTPTDINQEALKVSENVENVSTVTDSGLSLRDVDTVGSREADTVPEKTEININPEDSHRLELHSILNPVAHKRKMGSTRRPLGGNKGQRKGKEHHDDNETLNSESIRNREVEIFDMEYGHGPDKSTLRTSETNDGTTKKEREKCVENKAGPVEGIDSAHMSSSCSSDFQASTAVGISDILDEQTLTEFCAETLENAGDVEEVPVVEGTEPQIETQTQNITFDSTTNEEERTEENIHDVSVLVKPIEVIGDIITVKSNVTTDSDFLQNDTPFDRNQEALKVSENENVENVFTVTDSGLLLRDVDTVGSREADIVPEKSEININPEDSHRLELHSVLNPVAQKRKMGSTRRPLGGNKGQGKGKELHEGNVTLFSERNKEVETFDMEDEPRPDKSTLRTSETKDGTTEKEREICVDNNAGSVEGVDSAHMPSSFSSDFQESTAEGISDILEEQTLTGFCAETLENSVDVEEVPAGEETEPHLEIQTQNITFDSTTNEGERTGENIHDVSVLVKPIEVIGDIITVKSNVTTDSDFLQNDTPIDRNQEALKVSENENVENVSTVTDSGLLLRDVDTVGSREADIVPEKTEISINPEDSHRQELHSKLNPVAHKRKVGSTRRPLGGKKGQGKGKELHEGNVTLYSERNKEVETFDMEDEPRPDKSTLRTSETKDGTTEKEREICVDNNAGSVEGVDSAHMPSSFSSDFQESTAEGISDMLDEQTFTEFCAETMENAGDVEEVPVGEDTEPHLEIQSQNITGESSTNERERTEENIHDVSVLVKPIEVIGDTITVKSNVTTQSDFLQNDTPTDINQEALKVSENVENVSTVTDSGLSLRDVDTVGSREADTVPEKTEININPEDSHRLELHSILNPVAHKRKMGSTRRPLGGNKDQRKGKEHHDDNETLNSESIRNREVEIFDMEDVHGPDKSTLRTSETKDGTTEKEREICVENNAGPVEGVDSAHMSSSFSSDFQESTAEGISDILDEQTFTEFYAESLENAGDVEEMPVGEDTEPHLEIQSQNITVESSTNEGERTEENIHDVSVLVKAIEVIGDIITVKSNVTTQSDFLQNDTPTDINQEALKVSENVENVSTVTDSGLSLRDVDTVDSREADTFPEKTEININPEDSHRLELHSVLNPVAHKLKMGSTRRPLGGNKGQRKGKEYHDDNETLNSESIRNREVEIFDMEDEHGPDKSTLRTSETKDGTTKKEREKCVENKAGPVEGIDSAHMSSSCSSDFQASTAVGISDILEEQTLTEFCAETLEIAGDVEEVPVVEGTEPQIETQTQTITFDSTTNEGERTEENIHDVSVLVKAIEVIGDTITVKSNVTTDSDFLQNDTPIDRNQEALKVSKNENVENVSTVTDSGLLLRDVDTVGSREAVTVPEKTEISIIPEDSHRQEVHSKLIPTVHKRKMGSTRRPLGGNKGQRKGKEHHDDKETFISESIFNKDKEVFSLEDEHSPDKSTFRSSETEYGDIELEKEMGVKNDSGAVKGFDSAVISNEQSAVSISYITEAQTLTEFQAESQDNAGDVEGVPVGVDIESNSEIQTQNKTFDSATSETERTKENIHYVSVKKVIRDIVTVKSNMTIESDFLQNNASPDADLETLVIPANAQNVSTVTVSGILLRDVDTVVSEETVTVPEKTEISIIPEDSHRQQIQLKFNLTVHKRKMGSTRRPLRGNNEKRKGGEESKEKNGDNEGFAEEKDTECSKMQDQNNVVDHNMAQEIRDVRDNEEKEGNSVLESCDVLDQNDLWHSEIMLEQEKIHSSNISQTQNGAPHHDAGLQLPEDQEGMVDFVRDNPAFVSCSDLVLSDALLMEEAKIHASSKHVLMVDSFAPQTEEGKMHSVSNRSLQNRKMVLTRKTQKGKIMEKYHDVKEEKEDGRATKTEELFTLQESHLHQQLFSFSSDKESLDIQHEDSKSDRQTENPDQNNVSVEEQNNPNTNNNLELLKSSECAVHVTAETVSDLPFGDVSALNSRETYTVPKQSKIISSMPEDSHQEDVQSKLYPIVQKQKMGSTRKTFIGKNGQRNKEDESKEKDGEGATKEWDTESHLAASEGESERKFNEGTQFREEPGEFNRNSDRAFHPAATSKLFSKPEDEVNEVSVVSQEKGLGNTENESNSRALTTCPMSETKTINLYKGTEHKYANQIFSEDYFDQHAHRESEPEQTESSRNLFPTKELKNTQNDVVNENRIPATHEKKRKIGSTRRNPREPQGNIINNQDDFQEVKKEHLECTKEAGKAEDRQSEKKSEENTVYLDYLSYISSETPYKIINSQSKEVSSETFNITGLKSELVSTTDIKEDEKGYQNNSCPSESTGPEKLDKLENCQTGAVKSNTLQICDNQLTISKHPQCETIIIEKRRNMGSTRKNLRGEKREGKREGYEEIVGTHLQIQLTPKEDPVLVSEDIAYGMKIVGKAGEQTFPDSLDKSNDSLLSETERVLNKTSPSSLNLDYKLIINYPNSNDLVNTLVETSHPISVPENAEPQDDKDKGSSLQSSKTCIEPNSPRRRRKMGSTRKNPRQQLKIERGDDDKEAEKIAENLETSEQEIIAPKKGLEAAEEPTVHNIKESKGSKENLGVPSALTSSCQLEVSGNPVVQERTSPSAKRKFGSRRINKDNRGFGGLAASERRNELEEEDDKPYSSEVQDSLPRDDLMVCDPSLSLRPDQPVSQSVSEHSNMEARNEEAAKSVPKDKDVSTQEGTGAGLVSLDQIIKAGQHDISPGSRQTAHLKKSIKQETEVVQFNVVMLGNSCVGKTSFIRRFHEGQFSPDYCSTIGVDTCTQTVELHDRIVKLHIWDTAGQERFHSITTQVFHKADGLLLMYEITSSKSFISVRDWITKVQERAPDDAIMMLLGNKNDCEREVQIQEGEDLAREYKIHFMECSASTGVNVSESMRTLAQSLVQRKRDKKEEYTTLKRGQPQKKSGCC